MDDPIRPVLEEASRLGPKPDAPSFTEALAGAPEETGSVSVGGVVRDTPPDTDVERLNQANKIIIYNNNLMMMLLLHLLKQQQDTTSVSAPAPIGPPAPTTPETTIDLPTAPTGLKPPPRPPGGGPPSTPPASSGPSAPTPSTLSLEIDVNNLEEATKKILENLQNIRNELGVKASTENVKELQEKIDDLTTQMNAILTGINDIATQSSTSIGELKEENEKQIQNISGFVIKLNTQIDEFTKATNVESFADEIDKLGKRLDEIQASIRAEGGAFQQFQSMASSLLSAGSGAAASGSSGAFKLPFSKSTPVITIRGTEFEIVELPPMTTVELQKHIISLFPEMREGGLEITLQNAAGTKLPKPLETKFTPITLVPKVPRGSTSEAYELLSNFIEAQYKSFQTKVNGGNLEIYTGIGTKDIPLKDYTSVFGTSGKPAAYKYLYPPTPNIRVFLEMLATEQYFEIVDYLKKQGRDKSGAFGIFTVGSPEGETLPSKDMILLYEKNRSIVPKKEAFIGTLPTQSYFITAKATEIVEDIEGSPDSTNVVYIGGAPETALVRTKGKTLYLPFATAITQIFQRGISIESIGLQTALASLGVYYPYVIPMDKLKSFMEDVEKALGVVKSAKYGEFFNQTTVISALNVKKSGAVLSLLTPPSTIDLSGKAQQTPFAYMINGSNNVQTHKDITEMESNFRNFIAKTYPFINRMSSLTNEDTDVIMKDLEEIKTYLSPSLTGEGVEAGGETSGEQEYLSLQILIPEKVSSFENKVLEPYFDRLVQFIQKVLGYYQSMLNLLEDLLEYITVKMETIKQRSDGVNRGKITAEINKITTIIRKYKSGILGYLQGITNLSSAVSYKDKNNNLNDLLKPGKRKYTQQGVYPMIRFEKGTKIMGDISLPSTGDIVTHLS